MLLTVGGSEVLHFNFFAILSTAVSCQEFCSVGGEGAGARQARAASFIAWVSMLRLRFCSMTLLLLLGASSGTHASTLAATGFGFIGLAGGGEGRGRGLMLTRFGFGMLSLQILSENVPSLASTCTLQLLAT